LGKEIDFLFEWAVWGHLDSKTDLELILLKGHLLLETVLETSLSRCKINKSEDYSFYKKIKAFETIKFKETEKHKFIVRSLNKINRLRNNLAHEFHFDIKNGELELWSGDILENLEGEKFTRFTYRTKIVHAFSIISKNILNLTE
tara:strand:+ start:1298 stop:1732 length:435 start_codon:yes stop_codon:yes gene_type:complete